MLRSASVILVSAWLLSSGCSRGREARSGITSEDEEALQRILEKNEIELSEEQADAIWDICEEYRGIEPARITKPNLGLDLGTRRSRRLRAVADNDTDYAELYIVHVELLSRCFPRFIENR